jgi:transcription-repair coupling factor (superfamily II helicase)
MDLPKLSPAKRYALPCPISTADTLFLTHLAQREKSNKKIIVIITADAQDAQRIKDEISFFAPELQTALFPDWETLPYDTFSPHHDLISERLATLWQVLQSNTERALDIVLLPATTALYRLSPPSFLAAYTFHFKIKQKLNEAQLKSQLTMAGYAHVGQVVSPGEYTVRGSLIDLFPMGSLTPYRLDLFDDEIDSIRVFDPDTQRSLYPIPDIRLLPGREFPLDDDARQHFRNRWRETIEGDPSKAIPYKDIGNGIASAGIEYYLPLFFDEVATFFDYLPESATVVLHGDLEAPFQRFWRDTEERHRMAQGDPQRPVLAPSQLFLSAEQFFTRIGKFAQLSLRPRSADSVVAKDDLATPLSNLQVNRGVDDPLLQLKTYIKDHASNRILLVAESLGRRESLLDFFHLHQVNPVAFDSLHDFLASKEPLGIAVAALSNGFVWLEKNLVFITESELFSGAPSSIRRRKKSEQASDVDALVKDLCELKLGDPVVHINHGIGRYCGLIHMDLNLQQNQDTPELHEFLHLEYADKATLYVPVGQLHLISRYTGVNSDDAPLHRLGSPQWDRAKSKAAEQIRDSAAELLNIYAERQARQGHAFRFSEKDYELFTNDFGFEETPDQKAAIHAVIQDMISPKSMDRLICGDVGFGKTEVALRAAFVAVIGGKQVALLAPTTLLAEQHYQTLIDRFSKWPIKVAELSRFRSAKEMSKSLLGMADGTVDIVVGTHKLLSKDTKFKDLGLLIVDEEHRFGVRHKEQMKALRAEVDILTLTATPIPRTMGMALEGLRDLSVIATAPQRRLSIKTFVRTENDGIIREAILRELKRGGQIYFLHNDVATIENRQLQLAQLIPEARIAIAHGQMPERQLESVMRNFVAQRFNILLCSTIIETGIDVPTANTIIMARADKFGLAQLHQLRGRVGRSHHQAYAYLLVPDVQTMTNQAKLRLNAIESMQELGSGFYLAMHDLEIRGAGEILGENQSGDISEIGFQLYNDMLSEAVRCLKNGQEPNLLGPIGVSADINLHAPALIPNDYCGDVHVRLSFYKKLAAAKTMTNVDVLLEELADRFGKLPPAVHNLIHAHRLRVLGTPLGVVKVDATANAIIIFFKKNPSIDPMKIIRLVQQHKHIKLVGNEKLRIEREFKEVKDRVHMIRDLFLQLS